MVPARPSNHDNPVAANPVECDMSTFIQDLRFAVRTLTRARFVTLLAVLAFALGIGVTTAVFSIFNAVLLRPLPYPNPEQIVSVFDTQPACATCPASFPKYHAWRTRSRVFSAIGGTTGAAYTVTGQGDPYRVIGARATASFIDVFKVQPELGRWFTEQEDQFGGPSVVVLSHALWMDRFNGDRTVLGRQLTMDGKPYEIIGVVPAYFNVRRADFWIPLQLKLDPSQRGHFLATFARVKPDVTLEQATAQMRALGETLSREFAQNHGIDVRSYFEVLVGSIRPSLRILMGTVVLVLLIACANVANLLLASGLGRQREFAIRIALGARPLDLARQLTLESVILAVTGGLLGIVLARSVVSAFVYMAGTQLPRATTIAIDGRVVAFTLGISLLVGVVCGLWPLLRLRSRELTASVREGDTRTGSAGGRRLGNALVVAEIALAFTLLVGAGLLVKNLVLLRNRDAGIRTDHIVSFSVTPAGPRYQADESVTAFYRDLDAQLSHLQGVDSVGLISHVPMVDWGWNGEFQIEGALPWAANQAPLVEYRWLYGDYLKTMGVPLVKGRLLDARDGKGTRTVLINQAMADKFWPNQDPIGKRFGSGNDRAQWFDVVGVVGNVRNGLTRDSLYEFYRSIEQEVFRGMAVMIRTHDDDPTSIIPAARQIVASLDSSLPLTRIQTMATVVESSVGQPRLMSALTGLFGVLAGLLAMIGVYGVMAYNVRRQRREFGIRLALGANQARVRNLVVGRGLVLAGVGVSLGAAGAWLLTGVIQSLLNDVKPTDPTVFVGTAVAVVMVATLASYVPARSAGKVDPMVVLRDS
jgi:putative ABC transport system permease protein